MTIKILVIFISPSYVDKKTDSLFIYLGFTDFLDAELSFSYNMCNKIELNRMLSESMTYFCFFKRRDHIANRQRSKHIDYSD
jgi:hypothetical protein